MQNRRSWTTQEAKALHTSQLIVGVIKIPTCRRRENPLSKVAAAARATTLLEQCNELDYAPRDLMRRTNMVQ